MRPYCPHFVDIIVLTPKLRGRREQNWVVPVVVCLFDCSHISTLPNTHFKIQREAAEEKKGNFSKSTATTLNR